MPEISLTPFLQGFGIGAGLIIAIGPQNAFVLRQGLKRQNVFVTSCICTLCGATLIIVGIAGLSTLISSLPTLTAIATWGGAAFLVFYGFRSFKSAITPSVLDTGEATDRQAGLLGTVLVALALSLLNPHVYLDTVVLLGSIGAQYPVNERISFAGSSILASLT